MNCLTFVRPAFEKCDGKDGLLYILRSETNSTKIIVNNEGEAFDYAKAADVKVKHKHGKTIIRSVKYRKDLY